MEKEFSIVTADGRVQQKDNTYFPGKELIKASPEEMEEAVAYFEKEFSALEKYVNDRLALLMEERPSRQIMDSLDDLRNEIISAKAIGNFPVLISQVDEARNRFSTSDETTANETDTEDVSPHIGTEDHGEAESKVDNKPDEPTQTSEEPIDSSNDEEAKLDEEVEESSDKDSVSGHVEEESAAVEKPSEEALPDYSDALAPLAELAKQANSLDNEEWQKAQHELEHIRFKWSEIREKEENLASETGYQELAALIEQAEKKVAARKKEWQEKRREKKLANIEKRTALLDQLQEIIEKKKWQAFKEVSSISNRWENIKIQSSEEDVVQQERTYQELMKEFNDKKVELLVKKAKKEEENLTGKLAVLDKMSMLIESAGPETKNWEQLDVEVEELSRQWKKIGHVPLEQSEVVWDRFKKIRDDFFNIKYEHNESFRKQTVRNIRKKENVCEEAEALLEEKDLATAVRDMNSLHKKWKKLGAAPKEKNDELWERFNEATQKFNQIKSENQEVIKQQEQDNLDLKLSLCDKAEALKDSTEWTEVSNQLDALMEQWKAVGPIPRRKAGKVWKRFKEALDHFYENRRIHFRQVREEQKKNYEEKREIVKQLETLPDLEDSAEAVEKARALQEAFKKIGFVPIKKKSKLDKDYKLACDAIYQRARTESRKHTPSVKTGGTGQSRSSRDDFFKLKKECDNLREEILRYKDTMTFINPGGQGNALIEEVQQKVEKAEKILKDKEQKLNELQSRDDS